MKFDKLIKKTYTLLEQDEQNQPNNNNNTNQDTSEISSEVEKVGKKMGDQVETAEEELFSISKDLIQIMGQALQADNINLNNHPNLKKIFDDLNKASSTSDAKTGLPAIQQTIKSYTEDITKKPQPFNF